MSPENQRQNLDISPEMQEQPVRPITPEDLVPQANTEAVSYPILPEDMRTINKMIRDGFDQQTNISTFSIIGQYTLQDIINTYGDSWLVNTDGKGGYSFQAYEKRTKRIEGEPTVFPL